MINTQKYSDEIFIGDCSGKNLRAGIIIFSILLHITIIYLVYEADVKKSLIKKPKTITLVKIAPLMVPMPHEKIAKINKKAKFQKSGIPTSNNESLKGEARRKLESQEFVNLNIKKFSLGISGDRRLFFSSPKNKLNNFQIMMEGKKQVYNLIAKNVLKINFPTLLPGNTYKYSNKVGEDNIANLRFVDSLKSNSLNRILDRANKEVLKKSNVLSSSTFKPGEIHGYAYGVDNLSDVGGESFKKRKGFDILPWANKTLVRIKNFWKIPPSLNPGVKGKVGVSVVFNKGGDIKSLKVNRFASTQVFNQAAINAFNLGSPFDPLPNAILENKLKSYFVFNYYPSGISKAGNNLKMKIGQIKNINPFIKGIGFVEDKHFKGERIPESLCFGIESEKKVFYKVGYGEKILNGGELNKGFNFVHISSKNLFSKNQTYEYFLEVMNDGQKYKNKFFVDVSQKLLKDSGKIEKKVGKKGYGIAMFLENQLIVYHQKPIVSNPLNVLERALKVRIQSAAGPPDPFNVPGLTIQIPGVLYFGYKKLVEPMIKKKEKIKKVNTYKSMSGTFLRKNIEGLMQPIEVTLAFRGK